MPARCVRAVLRMSCTVKCSMFCELEPAQRHVQRIGPDMLEAVLAGGTKTAMDEAAGRKT